MSQHSHNNPELYSGYDMSEYSKQDHEEENPHLMLQPVNSRVLIQFIPVLGSSISLPEGVFNPDGKLLVLAIAPEVKCCSIGDHIIVIPGCNMIGLDEKEKTALIHDSSIIAIDKPANGMRVVREEKI